MGGFLSNILGTNSEYDPEGRGGGIQSGNPYGREMFQQQMANQQQIYGQQQGLANTFQAQMAGQGPNPAQTQYQQNMGTNIANAQGLISSQRGLNPALASRLGSNVAAQANQQAAAQSSVLQQNQQIQAAQNLGSLYGQMQQGNLGQQGAFNQANLGAMGENQRVAAGNQSQAGKLAGGLMSMVPGVGKVFGAAHGGQVPAMVSPGEVYLPPSEVESVKDGANAISSGRKISGKAKVKGDSIKNDTVSTTLEAGGIVLPRSVTQAKDAPAAAAKFVAAVLARKKHVK